MKRLKAFTILEVMVTMVISTIVIGGGFSAYEMSVKQYKLYEHISSVMNQVSAFHSVFERDIADSKTILARDRAIECIQKDKTVWYEFRGDYILRNLTSARDTFHVENDSLLLSFKNTEQSNVGGLVDRVKVRISLKGEKQSIIINKLYGADCIMAKTMADKYENGWN